MSIQPQQKEREEKNKELQRLIKLAETYKEQVRNTVRNLTSQYKQSRLTYEEYQTKITQTFAGRKPTELLQEYDQKIKEYERALQQNQEIPTKINLIIPLLVILIIGSITLLGPYITGLFTGFITIGETPYAETPNIVTNQDQIYTLTLPTNGELTSLKVTGILEGEGEAQIYLEDESYIIYDSAQDVKKQGLLTQLTGFITAALNTTFGTTTLQILNENNQKIPSRIEENNGITTITPELDEINQLSIDNLEGTQLGISTISRGIVEPINATFTKIYSLDTTSLIFDKGEVTATSTGNTLYSCSFWDFTLSICLNTWNYLQPLADNQEYTASFESGTIAFAEGISVGRITTHETTQSFPIELLDIAVNNFTLGTIAKFDVLVKNKEGEEQKVTAQFILQDENNKTLTTFSTLQTTLQGGNTQSLLSYWDTENTQEGTYNGQIKLTTGNRTEERSISITVTQQTITTNIGSLTGMAITPTVIQQISKAKKLFTTKCKDTCKLTKFNKTSYTIIIRVKDALLNLTRIEYTLKTADNQTVTQEITINRTLSNKTLAKIKGKKIVINRNKITFRDETPKQHKLALHKKEDKKEVGKDWERECTNNVCKHELLGYNKYYEKEDGSFELIKNALTDKNCEEGEEICVKSKDNTVNFKQKASDPETITIQKGNDTLQFEPLQLRYVEGNTQVILSSANPVNGKATDNKYTYENAFGEGIDIQLTYLSTELKEEIIFQDDKILQENNLKNATGFLSIDYKVQKPKNLDWYLGDLPKGKLTDNETIEIEGSIQLKDTTGELSFLLPQPVAYNSADTLPLTYTMTTANNEDIISIKIPLTYLQETTYPFIVDPSVFLDHNSVIHDGHVFFNQADPFYDRQSTLASFHVGDLSTVACGSESSLVCVYRGEIEWDVTSVPDNAEVTDVNLTVRIISNSPNTLFFHHMDGNSTVYDDTNAGNLHFFEDMGNGTNYVNVTFTGTDFRIINLSQSPTLVADLHTLLQSRANNWALGIRSNETNLSGSSRNFINSKEVSNVARRPKLTVTYGLPQPSILLETPLNLSRHVTFFNITFNATVYDNEPTIREVIYYGSDLPSPRAEDILAIFSDVANGTTLAYNWTAPVQQAELATVLLFHFDNRTEFGDNFTNIRDFSNQSNNGTMQGTGIAADNFIINTTGAKFGGTIDFKQSAAGTRNITLGDQDELIGANFTYMVWLQPRNSSVNGTILSKYDKTAPEKGFAIEHISGQSESEDLLIRTDSTVTVLSNFFNSANALGYTHLAITINNTNDMIIYKDGINITGAISIAGVTENDVPFTLAIETDQPAISSYVGTIDELHILNRTLNLTEIEDSYRLKPNFYYWYVNATDESAPANGTNMSEIRKLDLLDKLTIESLQFYPQSGNTTEDIFCNFTVIDRSPVGDLSAEVIFINGTTIESTSTVSVAKGVEKNVALSPTGLQARDETWNCGVEAGSLLTDQQSDQINTTNERAVRNSPPNKPILLIPAHQNRTTGLTPSFQWNITADPDNPDNDPGRDINYTLNITCYAVAGGSCTSPGDDTLRNVTTNGTQGAIAGDLLFKIDDGFYYNWSVRAFDGKNESVYSDERTLNVSVLIDISLVDNTLYFGEMIVGETRDTENEPSFDPFLLTHTGNSLIEVNISSMNTTFFRSVAIPSEHLQFKTKNITAAENAIDLNVSRSLLNFTNLDTVPQTIIGGYNYTNAEDAPIHFNTTVPLDEPSGGNIVTVLVEAYYFGGLA